MTTSSVLPARWASSGFLVARPLRAAPPTNQTHHSSSRSRVRPLTALTADASGDETLPETLRVHFLLREKLPKHETLIFFNELSEVTSAAVHDESRAGGVFRVQTCVAAVVNFTQTCRLTLLTTQRHSCEVRPPATTGPAAAMLEDKTVRLLRGAVSLSAVRDDQLCSFKC